MAETKLQTAATVRAGGLTFTVPIQYATAVRFRDGETWDHEPLWVGSDVDAAWAECQRAFADEQDADNTESDLELVLLWRVSEKDEWKEVSILTAADEDDLLIERVRAAAANATVSRAAVEFEWPECHRKGCAQPHGRPEEVFAIMSKQIAESVISELGWRATTRPDVGGERKSPEQEAVLALATLLGRYNVRDTGSFVRAAQLIVDAYPGLVPALREQ